MRLFLLSWHSENQNDHFGIFPSFCWTFSGYFPFRDLWPSLLGNWLTLLLLLKKIISYPLFSLFSDTAYRCWNSLNNSLTPLSLLIFIFLSILLSGRFLQLYISTLLLNLLFLLPHLKFLIAVAHSLTIPFSCCPVVFHGCAFSFRSLRLLIKSTHKNFLKMYFLLLTSSLFPLSSFSFLMLFALLSFMWDIFCEFLVILGSQSHAGVIINMTGSYVCGGRVLTGGPHS